MNDKPTPHEDDPNSAREPKRHEPDSSEFITTYCYSADNVLIKKIYDDRDPAKERGNHPSHHSRPDGANSSEFIATYCYSAENVFISMIYDVRDPRYLKGDTKE
jgi:hypothetical protein